MTGGRLYHHSAWAGWTLAPGAQNSMAWPGQDIANIDGKWVRSESNELIEIINVNMTYIILYK